MIKTKYGFYHPSRWIKFYRNRKISNNISNNIIKRFYIGINIYCILYTLFFVIACTFSSSLRSIELEFAIL